MQNGKNPGASPSPTNPSSSNAAGFGRKEKSAASAPESAKTTGSGLASIPKDASVQNSGNQSQEGNAQQSAVKSLKLTLTISIFKPIVPLCREVSS